MYFIYSWFFWIIFCWQLPRVPLLHIPLPPWRAAKLFCLRKMNVQNSFERFNFKQSTLQSSLLPWAAKPKSPWWKPGSFHELLLQVGPLLMLKYRYWDWNKWESGKLFLQKRGCNLLPPCCAVLIPCRQVGGDVSSPRPRAASVWDPPNPVAVNENPTTHFNGVALQGSQPWKSHPPASSGLFRESGKNSECLKLKNSLILLILFLSKGKPFPSLKRVLKRTAFLTGNFYSAQTVTQEIFQQL